MEDGSATQYELISRNQPIRVQQISSYCVAEPSPLCCLYQIIICTLLESFLIDLFESLQWGAADTEIKVPSDKNTEFKEYVSILPCMLHFLPGTSSLVIFTLPFHSPAFFFKSLPSFSFEDPQDTIGHSARCRGRLMQIPLLSVHRIQIGSEVCGIVDHNIESDYVRNLINCLTPITSVLITFWGMLLSVMNM